MTVQFLIDRIIRHEALNFALTNRLPRRLATRLMGWLSKVEQPLVRNVSIGIWRLSAARASRACVRSFSLASNVSWAFCHSLAETIFGMAVMGGLQ